MSAPSSAPSALQDRILHAIADAGGVIPFARFMAAALYEPDLGYYERTPSVVGRRGDFQTAVTVGPLFGELLAFQFATWLETPGVVPENGALHVVETGAHDGRLMADILGWLRTWRPQLVARIQPWILDPSPRRRDWQRETLGRAGFQVEWAADPAELGQRTGGVNGVLYSNELLDAFPVHRLAWSRTRSRWQELGVAWDGERFVGRRMPDESVTAATPDLHRLSELPAELLSVLPDGFLVEVCPAAADWWREMAGILRSGVHVALDYGFPDDTVLRPEHPEGTLRAYRAHQVSGDVLTDPGEQDLTAQVDFGAIASVGAAAGLRTLAREPQRRWLTRIFEATLNSESGFSEWDAPRVRQFQTLTHPEHLGRRFQVLAQARAAT
ncbi:MAG: SAM-dependent methyltransferase [Verrucomicrobiales bacterium]|nr:SAM-dependent methyltransferase [Verrucomicrobiales bacterium]